MQPKNERHVYIHTVKTVTPAPVGVYNFHVVVPILATRCNDKSLAITRPRREDAALQRENEQMFFFRRKTDVIIVQTEFKPGGIENKDLTNEPPLVTREERRRFQLPVGLYKAFCFCTIGFKGRFKKTYK